MKHDSALVKINLANRALAQAKTLQEVKRVMSLADAARLFAKQTGAATETINIGAELKLHAERRLGEMLEAAPKSKGAIGSPGPGRGKRGTRKVPRFSNLLTLEETGITKNQSSVAQKLAAVPKSKGTRGQLRGKSSGGTRKVPPERTATLAEVGITKNQSSVAQKLAAVPEERFGAWAVASRRLSRSVVSQFGLTIRRSSGLVA